MKNKYIVTGIQNDVAAVRQVGRDLTGFVAGAKYLTIGETVELSAREVTFDGQLAEYQALWERYNAVRKIQINYLASDDKTVLASHKTDDDWTADERKEWEVWLNDNAVEHPGAPAEGWSSFELVAYVA